MAKPLSQVLRGLLLGETVQLNLSGNAETPETAAGLTLLNLETPSAPVAVVKEAPVSKAPDMSGSGITVIDLGGNTTYSTLLRKGNVKLFRNYAKNSSWVRAAIDYHRRMLGRAVFEIVPIDSTEKLNRLNKNVRDEVETFLRAPNTADDSYGTIKEQWIEDYLVVGHGTAELDLARDLTVRGMRILDAARIGFVKSWDGTDRTTPRFCEFADAGGATIKRYLAH